MGAGKAHLEDRGGEQGDGHDSNGREAVVVDAQVVGQRPGQGLPEGDSCPDDQYRCHQKTDCGLHGSTPSQHRCRNFQEAGTSCVLPDSCLGCGPAILVGHIIFWYGAPSELYMQSLVCLQNTARQMEPSGTQSSCWRQNHQARVSEVTPAIDR